MWVSEVKIQNPDQQWMVFFGSEVIYTPTGSFCHGNRNTTDNYLMLYKMKAIIYCATFFLLKKITHIPEKYILRSHTEITHKCVICTKSSTG